jgi:hypothetical protein
VVCVRESVYSWERKGTSAIVDDVNQSNEMRGETSFPCETHVRMKEIGASGPWPHASITTSKVQMWSAEPRNHAQYSQSDQSSVLKRQSNILIQSKTNNNGNIGYLNQTSRAEEEVIKKEKGKLKPPVQTWQSEKQQRPPNRHSTYALALFLRRHVFRSCPTDIQVEKNTHLRFPTTIRKFAFHLLRKENRCLVFVHHVSYVLSHVIEKIEEKQKGKGY